MDGLRVASNSPSARARNRRASPAELRERILNAADGCFEREGVARTTIEDISMAADVSRATLYRMFTGRDELLLAVFMRELDRISGQLIAGISHFESIEDVLTEGIVICVRTIKGDRKLAGLFGPDAAAITGRIAGSSDALLVRARQFGRILLDSPRPGDRQRIRPDMAIDDIADHLVHVILSIIVLPTPSLSTDEHVRRYARTIILPALIRHEQHSDQLSPLGQTSSHPSRMA